ncbi:MAG: WD40 repeat domain-containing protein [Bacteroidota bacterium]
MYRNEEKDFRYQHSKSLIGHTANVLNVSFYDQGNVGISSGEDGNILLWNLEPIEAASQEIEEFYGGSPIRIKYNSTDKKLYAGISFKEKIGDSSLTADYMLRFKQPYDYRSKEFVKTYVDTKSRDNSLNSFDFRNGTDMIVGDVKGRSLVIASEDTSKIEVYAKVPWGEIVDIKARDQRLVVALENRLLYFSDINDPASMKPSMDFRLSRFTSIDIHPEKDLVMAGGRDGNLYFWDVTRDTVLPPRAEHKDRVLDVSFSNEGKFIVSCSADDTVVILQQPTEGDTYQWLTTITEHTSDVNDVEISDSGLVASAGMGADRRVLLHQITVNELGNGVVTPLTSLIRHDWGIRGVAINDDDDLIYTVDGQGILKVWKYKEFESIIEDRTAHLKLNTDANN